MKWNIAEILVGIGHKGSVFFTELLESTLTAGMYSSHASHIKALAEFRAIHIQMKFPHRESLISLRDKAAHIILSEPCPSASLPTGYVWEMTLYFKKQMKCYTYK